MFLVEHKNTGKKYAMKRVPKSFLKSQKSIIKAQNERSILETNNHPFMVRLHYAFQDDKHLYYIINFAEGGELFTLLQHKGVFSEKTVKLYAAELVLVLQYMHNSNIHYNDLKLENVLIGRDGHILLVDFGLSKYGLEAISTCGTLEYLSPEALTERRAGFAGDWWALVC